MGKIIFGGAIAIAILGSGAYAATGVDLYNACGNGFKAGILHRDSCHSFIIGIADGLARDGKICPKTALTAQQATMVVQAYMKAHPDELGEDADLVIRSALMQSFGCS